MQNYSKIKVSQETAKLVDQIKSLDGDKRKIDSRREYDMLKNALAGICDDNDRSYIKDELGRYSDPGTEPKPAKKAKPKTNRTWPPKKTQPKESQPQKEIPQEPGANNQPVPTEVRNTQRNNNVNGNNNTTINGNNNTIVVNNGVGVENTNASGSSSKAKSRPLTPGETKQARENGEIAADLLVGYTTDSEQLQVKSLLAKVDKRNVMEFLRGYTENKGLGDDFFTQMRTENGFKANQNLMHNVARHLQAYLADKYGADDKVAKEVAVILLESEFTSKETEALDKIVTDELEK